MTGPWENSPYNPIVHTYSATDSWWSKGHGTLIDDVNGNWWIVYHAYANGYHTLGRSTLIEPIEWTEDGWYRTVSAATPVTRSRKSNMDWNCPMISKVLNWDFSGLLERICSQIPDFQGGYLMDEGQRSDSCRRTGVVDHR